MSKRKRTPTLPYENAEAKDALAELQKALAKFGCGTFGTMTDVERGVTIVQFKWRTRQISLEASWKGYAAAWLRINPYEWNGRVTKEQHHERALALGKKAVASCLRDWVKGQITAIECGVMSFEAAFMPHILLPSGRRLIDEVEAHNLLPAPPDEKVVQIGNGKP